MSIPAQHASLKILEEHPSFIRFILHAKTSNSLLDTITSRCQVHYLYYQNTTQKTHKSLQTIFQDIQSITKKDQALQYLDDLIPSLRQRLKQHPNSSNLKNLRVTIQAQKMLKSNAHIQLTLHHLALTIHS